MHKEIIPHSRPTLGKEEADAVSRVILSGNVVQGEKVKELERTMCRRTGRKYGVALSSGTAALHLALLALGVKEGDEVMLPGFCCPSVLMPVLYVGAKPIFIDCRYKNPKMDIVDIMMKFSNKTKAIIIPHPLGLFEHIASSRKLLQISIIEDCATGLGLKSAGHYGDISVFSFYATKMACAGEGGMILTDSKRCYLNMLSRRKPHMGNLSFNYKMTDIEAQMAIIQLKRLKGFIKQRKRIASEYDRAFGRVSEKNQAYYRYLIFIEKDCKEKILRLKRKGIMCERPYAEIIGDKTCPNARYLSNHLISIPIYPSLKKKQIDYIIRSVKEVFS